MKRWGGSTGVQLLVFVGCGWLLLSLAGLPLLPPASHLMLPPLAAGQAWHGCTCMHSTRPDPPLLLQFVFAELGGRELDVFRMFI
jgi:hypothetical protein